MCTSAWGFAYWMRGSMARSCYTIGRPAAKSEELGQSYAATRASNSNDTVVCVYAAAKQRVEGSIPFSSGPRVGQGDVLL